MDPLILVLNAGSSSLKFGLFETPGLQTRASGTVDWREALQEAEITLRRRDQEPLRWTDAVADYAVAVQKILESLLKNRLIRSATDIEAIGQRVVHGGTHFRQSVRLDAAVKSQIEALAELAPLHNPPALQAIQAAERAFPKAPQVAVFDTAFFQSLPPRRYLYPVPYEWYSQWGVRRFGFHGISHSYCAGRGTALLQKKDARLVICHLGQGCSATATIGLVPVTTTMGFTPLEGLMMGTRPGSIDPGILLYLQRQHRQTPESLEETLNHGAGLKGISGVSSDYRQVEKAADAGNERAQEALAMFADRIRATIGAMTVTLGGIDALIFTAGIGENGARLRTSVCEGLGCIGIKLDAGRNETAEPDADIAAADSPARILVIHTQEEKRIAEETLRAL